MVLYGQSLNFRFRLFWQLLVLFTALFMNILTSFKIWNCLIVLSSVLSFILFPLNLVFIALKHIVTFMLVFIVTLVLVQLAISFHLRKMKWSHSHVICLVEFCDA